MCREEIFCFGSSMSKGKEVRKCIVFFGGNDLWLDLVRLNKECERASMNYKIGKVGLSENGGF